MSADVDLLVVGAGPVGLGTALLAAKAGLSVAVVDPRPDPIDKACGEGLMPSALAMLAELGVDPPGRTFAGIRYLDATGHRSAQARFRRGQGRGVRRTVLQEALSQAVEKAGVARIQERVQRVRQNADRVEAAGISGRYLAAADGLHSVVSRQYDLDRPGRARPRFGLRRHYAVAPWSDLVEVHWAEDAEAYVTPIGADMVGVAMLTDHRGRSFDDLLTGFPALAGRLAGSGVASSTRGAGPLEHNVHRRVMGRVLLVGDAAGYVDALTGEGIAVGLGCARLLVRSVLAERPDAYEAGWPRASRRYRLVTRAVLITAQQQRLRRSLVPTASAAPWLFGRLVDTLA